jgi:hypothetical protein
MNVNISDAIATEPISAGSGACPIIIVSTTPSSGVDTFAIMMGIATLNRSLLLMDMSAALKAISYS